MADNRSKAQRSYNMSKIKSSDTKPEMIVRKYLFDKGFRYRLHLKTLVGKPDIVLNKHNSIIFINGCFWHGHSNCKHAKVPISNNLFWINKIFNNKERDKKVAFELEQLGWKVFVVWECELNKNVKDKTLETLIDKILDKQ